MQCDLREGFVLCNRKKLMRTFKAVHKASELPQPVSKSNILECMFGYIYHLTLIFSCIFNFSLHYLVPAHTATGADTDLHSWSLPFWLEAGVQVLKKVF